MASWHLEFPQARTEIFSSCACCASHPTKGLSLSLLASYWGQCCCLAWLSFGFWLGGTLADANFTSQSETASIFQLPALFQRWSFSVSRGLVQSSTARWQERWINQIFVSRLAPMTASLMSSLHTSTACCLVLAFKLFLSSRQVSSRSFLLCGYLQIIIVFLVSAYRFFLNATLFTVKFSIKF